MNVSFDTSKLGDFDKCEKCGEVLIFDKPVYTDENGNPDPDGACAWHEKCLPKLDIPKAIDVEKKDKDAPFKATFKKLLKVLAFVSVLVIILRLATGFPF